MAVPLARPLLDAISTARPTLERAFELAYATLWFTTPFFVSSIALSLLYILSSRWDREPSRQALPSYPPPSERQDLFLVLGEVHHRTRPEPVANPHWLVIPERGLYTGIAIVGAIATGKTVMACDAAAIVATTACIPGSVLASSPTT